MYLWKLTQKVHQHARLVAVWLDRRPSEIPAGPSNYSLFHSNLPIQPGPAEEAEEVVVAAVVAEEEEAAAAARAPEVLEEEEEEAAVAPVPVLLH